MRRTWQVWYAAASLLLATYAARAQEADPALLFPEDTFVYVEADAGNVVKGLQQLDLVRIAADPRFRAYLKPALDAAGLDGANLVRDILRHVPVQTFLAGKAAVGIRGFHLTFNQADGSSQRFDVSPQKPIDARLLYQLVGMTFADEMGGMARLMPDVEFGLDGAAMIEPGPALQEQLKAFLADPPPWVVKKEEVQVGGRQVVHLKIDVNLEDFFSMASDLYLDVGGERWLVSTDREHLAAAQGGTVRRPLANNEGFTAVRSRLTSDGRVAFGFVDLAGGLRMFRNLVPPILMEACEINGLAALRGAGFGISMTEGGIRESFGVVLDGNPRGFWRLLDAFPGGLRAVEVAPPDAIGVIGARFDAALFVKRLEEVMAELLPGRDKQAIGFIDEAFRDELGVDLRKEILPALGDEVSLVLFPPRGLGLPVPGFVFSLEVRDEKVFAALLDRIKAAAEKEARGSLKITPTDITDEIKGFQILAPIPLAAPPIFAVHKGHLFGAHDKKQLLAVIEEWGKEGSKALAADGEVFAKVLKGLNGGERKNLVALAYFDARAIVPVVLKFTAALIPDEVVDKSATPDFDALGKELSGLALGVRKDAHGVFLDAFSPVGFVLPSMAAGMLVARQVEAQQVRRVQQAQAQAQQMELDQQDRRPDAAFDGLNAIGSDGTGVTVYGMLDGSPASAAGLKANDKIVKIDAVEVKTITDLKRERLSHQPGDEVVLTIERGDTRLEVKLKLARRGDFYK